MYWQLLTMRSFDWRAAFHQPTLHSSLPRGAHIRLNALSKYLVNTHCACRQKKKNATHRRQRYLLLTKSLLDEWRSVSHYSTNWWAFLFISMPKCVIWDTDRINNVSPWKFVTTVPSERTVQAQTRAHPSPYTTTTECLLKLVWNLDFEEQLHI